MCRACAGLLAVLLAPSAWAATPGTDPSARAQAILKQGGYQTELPLVSPAPKPEVERSSAEHPGAGAEAPPPFSVAVPPRGVLIAAVALLVAAGMVLLFRGLGTGRRAEPVVVPVESAGPPSRRQSGADPEALALAGRFAEAIHALLLQALRELGRRAAGPAAHPAWTSREVLRSPALAADARAALAPLVASVESVHFGGVAAGPEEYAAGAASYRRFQEACRPAR